MPPNKSSMAESLNSRNSRVTFIPVVSYGDQVAQEYPQRSQSGQDEKGEILRITSKGLLRAADGAALCEEALKERRDMYDGSVPLVFLARLHNVQTIREALFRLVEVTDQLSKSLEESLDQCKKAERQFTSVLVNTLSKESMSLENSCRRLSPKKEDSGNLEKEIDETRASLLRCVQAFQPIRLAIFRPDRRSSKENQLDGDSGGTVNSGGSPRVDNQTREYLRSLDVDWGKLSQVMDCLPLEARLSTIISGPGDCEKELLDSEDAMVELLSSGRRYWPV